jgi:hypothetical protein
MDAMTLKRGRQIRSVLWILLLCPIAFEAGASEVQMMCSDYNRPHDGVSFEMPLEPAEENIFHQRADLSDPIITRSVSEATAYDPRLRFGLQTISPAGGIYEQPPECIVNHPADNFDELQQPSIAQPEKQPSDAGFGIDGKMGPGLGGKGPISFKTIWFPSAPLRGQTGKWGLVGQDLSARYPIWIDPPNMIMITAGARDRLIETDAILPDSHQPYPNELWDARIGLMYIRRLGNERLIGGGINLGSASDHPFASIREMNVSFNALYRIPSGERNAWMFMLMYSPVGELKIPIPGVAYIYNPSDQFRANIGLPLAISYKPNDRWSFDISYMLIHTIHAKATYKLSEKLKLSFGYDWSNEVYMLRDRTDINDRFFLYDQRLTMGLEMPITQRFAAELGGGYAFDRYSFTGQNWNSSGTDRVEIAPGPFMELNISLRK